SKLPARAPTIRADAARGTRRLLRWRDVSAHPAAPPSSDDRAPARLERIGNRRGIGRASGAANGAASAPGTAVALGPAGVLEARAISFRIGWGPAPVAAPPSDRVDRPRGSRARSTSLTSSPPRHGGPTARPPGPTVCLCAPTACPFTLTVCDPGPTARP